MKESTVKLSFKIVNHLSNEWNQAVQLREKILRKPLGIKFSKEELLEEKDHIHIVGIVEKSIVATAALVPEISAVKMQRVVVDEKLRNDAIGSRMIHYCESIAKSHGFIKMYCHARSKAIHFYSKVGYRAVGNSFIEDGIPHRKMSKNIP